MIKLLHLFSIVLKMANIYKIESSLTYYEIFDDTNKSVLSLGKYKWHRVVFMLWIFCVQMRLRIALKNPEPNAHAHTNERAHKHTGGRRHPFCIPFNVFCQKWVKTINIFCKTKFLRTIISLGTVITLTGISISKNQKSRLRYRIQINRTINHLQPFVARLAVVRAWTKRHSTAGVSGTDGTNNGIPPPSPQSERRRRAATKAVKPVGRRRRARERDAAGRKDNARELEAFTMCVWLCTRVCVCFVWLFIHYVGESCDMRFDWMRQLIRCVCISLGFSSVKV